MKYDTIKSLVEKFSHNIEEYKNPKYNEAQIRIEFVNPFFEELGWDVSNKAGYAISFRDVIHEDEVKVGSTTKAPDYSFRIGGRRIFFVETKKPSVDLKHNPAPAFQLRRYAYSSGLSISILTDFEEFIVYDCRLKPAIDDKPAIGRMLYFTYQEYIEKWDQIHSIFSKEAVMRGDLDRWIGEIKGKRPREELNQDFLADLDRWRMILARTIALRNPSLSQRELNWVVQLTINRLIFLRMCEDRGIESPYTLQALQNGTQCYKRLVEIYYRADERYNSGLFHFDEKDGSNPDTLTPELNIDDKVLKEIIAELYYPKCAYEFSVLPVEILGHAYEQFLGKIIRLTEGHQAKVEEKPEVRKAGGVYYTPQYIVDYIVKNTVGKLLEGKTPAEASELHILDPACGSGSFLLGSFQYLMDWHLKKYVAEHEKTGKIPSVLPSKSQRSRKSDPPAIFQGMGEQWFLSTAEKKRILINNMYGVDIDANAVEVTKLSLLLKVLEHESGETIHSQMKMWHERALPNLAENIKCGNSLIGPDYFSDQLLPDNEELQRVNPFNWAAEFPEVMRGGGFDCVIGNPPYVFGGSYGIESADKFYFKEQYQSGIGKINLFTLFLEKSIKVSRQNGMISFIIPNTFLRVTSYATARKFVLENSAVLEIVDMGSGVFAGATTSSIIVVLQRKFEPLTNKVTIRIGMQGARQIVPQKDFDRKGFVLNIRTSSIEARLLSKLEKKSINLGELCEELIFGVVITKNRDSVVSTKKRSGWKPFLEGKDISRYVIRPTSKYLLYKPELLHRSRTPCIFEAKEKLLIQRITGGLRPLNVAYDASQYYNKESINNLILKSDTPYSIKYILGLINSRLINWFYKTRFTNESYLTVNLSKEYLSQIPIPSIVFTRSEDKARHDKMVMLVEQMLDLHKRKTIATDAAGQERLQRLIDATDNRIDALVYELYGFTPEEIAVVEDASK